MMKSMLARPMAVLLLSVMILAAGVMSAVMLPIKLQPDVNAPFLMVYAGVKTDTDLDTMEKEVALPLESLAMSSEMVKDVMSTTSTRGVNMEVILKDSAKQADVDKLRDELNQKLNALAIQLDARQVIQFSTSDQAIMYIAVTSDAADQESVRRELKEVLVPKLRKAAGVSKVEHTLDRHTPNYKLVLKPEQMKSLQHASQLADEIRTGFASPLLGSMDYNNAQHRVRSSAEVASMEELANYRFSTGERLTDVADLTIDRASDHSYLMMSGKPYYEINVFASKDASEVKVSAQIRSIMKQAQEEQHTEWDYVYAWDASAFIGQAVSELVINIAIGALIAAAILFIVFRSVRTTLVVAISMPICIAVTFISMSIFGYSVNLITLMGIGLGTGMIVDACIVVIENIFRKMQQGAPRAEAVVEGTKEVFTPVLASITTTVAVFLPISFMDGVVGEFLKQLGFTVTVSLFASLIVSLTVIPILSNRLIKAPKTSGGGSGKILMAYEKVLTYVLRRKWRALLAFTLVLIVSLYTLVAFIPKNYIPNVSDRSLYIQVEVDKNIDFDTNFLLLDQTAQEMLSIDGVKDVLYWGNDWNTASGTFIVMFENRSDMEQSDEEMKSEIRETIDRMIPYSLLSIGEGQADLSGQMTISLSSSRVDELVRNYNTVQEELKLMNGVTGVKSELAEGGKEWIIQFSREQLSYHNITRREVEQYIGLVLNGVQDIDVKLNGKASKAAIEFPEVFRKSSDGLYRLPIRSHQNLTVRDVAELKQVESEASRFRKNGSYDLTVSIYFDAEQKDSVVRQVTDFVNASRSQMPISLAGAQLEQAEGFGKLLIAVAVSFAAVFFILTIQFNRFRLPFLIMLSLPFAMIGVTAGFLLTGREFDIMAMIGIVMLVGIVVNNAIVLIDFINKHRGDHEDVFDAVVEGAKLRLRPIMTTTITTVGGLVPMFIGGSEASSFQTPIATAVIFGLLFSTFVSLLLVPAMYLIFEGRRSRRLKQAVQHAEAETAG